MIAVLIDDNGYFLRNEEVETLDLKHIDHTWIDEDKQLFNPRWEGSQWGEGATSEEISTMTKQSQVMSIKLELQELDTFLPRCMEDVIVASGINVVALPQIMQDRIARKTELRNQLREVQ
jgi:hypothetical protein